MATDPRERLLAEDEFEGEAFVGLDLHAVDLSRKEFRGCTFTSVRMPETRWVGAVLDDCAFERCELANVVPTGLALRDVRFFECKLLGVAFRGIAPTPRVAFDGCDLRYTEFAAVDLRKAPFLRSLVTEATFVEVDLAGADFAGSDLTGSTFRDCTLRNTDFSGARGVLVDPAKNRVKDVRVSLESAVLLATSFGMRVSGFDSDPPPRRRR